MAGGFPLRYEGHDYKTSEHLYQCFRFPDHPDVQELIRSKASPMGAKMASKPHRATKSRSDWDEVRTDVMRFCLRLKLQSYRKSFGDLLLRTGEKPIVEESRKNTADVWSARACEGDMLVGDNLLGLLLMELREEFKTLPANKPISMTVPAYRSRES